MTDSYFLDTSALFKRYVQEEGSETVDILFNKEENIFLISSITICEVVSNLRRLVDVDRLISEKEFDLIKATFLGEIADGLLELTQLTTNIILESLEIISKKYVTPLDAIQLATALSLPEKPVFVCADKKLLRIAKDSGLEVLNP